MSTSAHRIGDDALLALLDSGRPRVLLPLVNFASHPRDGRSDRKTDMTGENVRRVFEAMYPQMRSNPLHAVWRDRATSKLDLGIWCSAMVIAAGTRRGLSGRRPRSYGGGVPRSRGRPSIGGSMSPLNNSWKPWPTAPWPMPGAQQVDLSGPGGRAGLVHHRFHDRSGSGRPAQGVSRSGEYAASKVRQVALRGLRGADRYHCSPAREHDNGIWRSIGLAGLRPAADLGYASMRASGVVKLMV